jgi:peroxiredoxin Q/BCP
MLSEGDTAPGFALLDHEGRTVKLEDERGSWVVLWWYPKASTAG